MASTQDLIKYYNTLRVSFDKIQDKVSSSSLVSAAFRLKIADECMKSVELFESYIEYAKLFCAIHPDKFIQLSTSVIFPMLGNGKALESEKRKVIEFFEGIIRTDTTLANELANSIERILLEDRDLRSEEHKAKYLNRSFIECILKLCLMMEGNALVTTLQALMKSIGFYERLSDANATQEHVSKYFEIIYDFLEDLKQDDTNLDKICRAFLEAFSRDEKFNLQPVGYNYLIFYISSLKTEYCETIIESLWFVFDDIEHNTKHRKSSILFLGSYLAHADFIDIDKIMTVLDMASQWWNDLADYYKDETCERNFNDDRDLALALAESVFYIIGQRYKEFYLDDIAKVLVELNFDSLLSLPFSPLDNCDRTSCTRFKKVAKILFLYDWTIYEENNSRDLSIINSSWIKKPFPESSKNADIPDKVKPLMRFYVEPNIFTICK